MRTNVEHYRESCYNRRMKRKQNNPLTPNGRGALENPAGRFEPLQVEADPEAPPELDEEGQVLPRRIRTQVFRDKSRSIISTNDSPDVGLEATLNPYRGCEHGCIYCFARPT